MPSLDAEEAAQGGLTHQPRDCLSGPPRADAACHMPVHPTSGRRPSGTLVTALVRLRAPLRHLPPALATPPGLPIADLYGIPYPRESTMSRCHETEVTESA